MHFGQDQFYKNQIYARRGARRQRGRARGMSVPRAAPASLLLRRAAAHARAADGAERARVDRRGDAAYTYTVGALRRPSTSRRRPASYTLPVIDRVADHPLLDSDGDSDDARRAETATASRSSPSSTPPAREAAGCPLAEAIMQRLDRPLADDPALASRVRLLTISFDPERDTPARMATVRERVRRRRPTGRS